MKYRQLTKEQFSALHEDFARFLATQQIDVKEWEDIKKNKPDMAEDELNIFSDTVWEDVLTKTEYLDHISEKHINLFKCTSKEMIRLYIRLNDSDLNFLDEDDFKRFLENPLDSAYEYFTAKKNYQKERNLEIFKMIEMGSQISKGDLFNHLSALVRQ